jgi:hypothetical protein
VAVAEQPLLAEVAAPQAMLKGTSTWSPLASFCTPEPTSSTIPQNSWPKVEPTRVSGTSPL